MTVRTALFTRGALGAFGVCATLLLAACGGSGGSAKVASLNGDNSGASGATTTTISTEDALLAYTACMRKNGIDMADPTFDANGNPTGGFGRDANPNIDRTTEAFRAAQNACGSLLRQARLGGRGRNFDPQAIQDGLNNFTACLRKNGLQVNDITFGPRNGNGGNGGNTTGTGAPDNGGPPPDGSVPGGGFGGPPGTGGTGRNGGAGFDPTTRIIERLGLDATDPAVTKAIDACKPILTAAFTPTTTTNP